MNAQQSWRSEVSKKNLPVIIKSPAVPVDFSEPTNWNSKKPIGFPELLGTVETANILRLTLEIPGQFWRMKRLIFLLSLFVGYLDPLSAEPFSRAEVTKAINRVSVLPQNTQAVRGDVIKGDRGLKTGGNSRAELQFPDLTITRLGSNSLFRFVAGTRDMILDGGTMLFSSPQGVGGGKVQAGAITAAVTGSDFMISNVGSVKVICLSHKLLVYFTANPRIRTELLPGQMLDVAIGVERRMPRVTTINLGILLATSLLTESGGFRALPSRPILAQNTIKQAKAFSLGNSNLASETAETTRSSAVATSSQVAEVATAGEIASTTRNSEDQKSKTPGNSGKNENPGNSGARSR